MRAHRVRKVVFVMAVVLASCVVHCREFQPGRGIPPRCRQASVTPVSCSQAPRDSLLPHPDDCELFYYCVSARAPPVCRQCPARLHFNPRLRVCDYPAVAGCHIHHPTHTTSGETTYTITTTGEPTHPDTIPGETTNTEPTLVESTSTDVTAPELVEPATE